MDFPSDEDTTLSAWAHAYAEAGWPVFPLVPKNKQPITADGFKSASTDHDQVAHWWIARPQANIGLATGHVFDVLDVDGTVGSGTLQDHLIDTTGQMYTHRGPFSFTGKGWHMFFAPTGKGNGTALLGPNSKLDYRGFGGYVVAPPSVHPLGHRYRWDAQRGPELGVPPAPDWLLGILDRDQNPTTKYKRQAIVKNEFYETLMQGGYIPLDQLPRGKRQSLQRPDILEVCGEMNIALRKRSRYYVALCIFHAEDTPSMTIYPSNNTFFCYGCQAHGDSFDLKNRKHL